jgi:hypothetical protein
MGIVPQLGRVLRMRILLTRGIVPKTDIVLRMLI